MRALATVCVRACGDRYGPASCGTSDCLAHLATLTLAKLDAMARGLRSCDGALAPYAEYADDAQLALRVAARGAACAEPPATAPPTTAAPLERGGGVAYDVFSGGGLCAGPGVEWATVFFQRGEGCIVAVPSVDWGGSAGRLSLAPACPRGGGGVTLATFRGDTCGDGAGSAAELRSVDADDWHAPSPHSTCVRPSSPARSLCGGGPCSC